MILTLQLTGSLLIVLALVHGTFPSYFKWKSDLKPLSLINRQMMYVHTFFIALTVLLMGLLCLTQSEALINTALGKVMNAGMCFFWLCRLIVQFWGYSPQLWKGKTFETTIHVLFSLLWCFLTLLFGYLAIC